MNNYPKWWSDDITIYNKFEDGQTQLVKWYKTSISGVFWKNVGNYVLINGISLDTNSIICRIRKNDKYLSKGRWDELPNDQMSEYFTLANGDIIIKGNVDDIIDEYTAGKRSSDLINKYKALGECLIIDRVGDNTGTGRGQEHYMVSGR